MVRDNIYQLLTRAFNDGRLRAILSSGQAVVMHRRSEISSLSLRERGGVRGLRA